MSNQPAPDPIRRKTLGLRASRWAAIEVARKAEGLKSTVGIIDRLLEEALEMRGIKRKEGVQS